MKFTLWCALSLLFLSRISEADQLFSVNMFDCDIRMIDSANGLTQAIHFIQSPGLVFNCSTFGHGLARDSSDGKLYALIQQSGNNTYDLAKFDPISGNLSLIGNTDDRFDGLAFNQDGSALFGVTSDDASVPETLFLLNKVTANANKLCTLGNGDDGEVIAFNTDDGLIYHSSGQFTDVFEKINPATCQTTSIGLTPDNFVRPTALLYAGSNNFLLADFDTLLDLSNTGRITFTERFMDHASKGLAFSTASITITDLEITGTCSRQGKSGLTESITVQNTSTTAAKNVVVGSKLPPQISFVSDGSNACSASQGFLVCALGNLAALNSINLQIQYQVNLGRKENIRHDLRVSSNEFETPQEFLDNLLSINSKCKR